MFQIEETVLVVGGYVLKKKSMHHSSAILRKS